MKVKCFDRATLKVVRTKMDKALLRCGRKLGVTFIVGHITFRDNFCSIKVEAQIKGAPSKFVENYEKMRLLDRKLPRLGTIISFKGEKFKVVGGNPRAVKRAIQLERVRDSKAFATSVESLISVLNKK